MLEVLQFIFSSFWIWLGTLILISAPFMFFSKASLIKFKFTKNIAEGGGAKQVNKS